MLSGLRAFVPKPALERSEGCLRACLLLFLAAGPYVPAALATTETAKLVAADGAAGDHFGSSIAVSGDTMVVGAQYDDGLRGSAYVFVRSAGTWTQQAKLTASDGAVLDEFGISVSISGDTVVVGAAFDDIGPNTEQGTAYVFVKPGGGWADMTQTAKLTASDGAAYDFFGWSVGVSGDTVVVGAYFDEIGPNVRQGSAYVFVKPGGGWANMTQTAKLTALDGTYYDFFGYSVAVSGNTVVVGANTDDIGANSNQGSAYVFVKPGGGWADMTQTAKLTASDGATSDHFGVSVAVSSDTVVVGAWFDDIGPNADQGSAYVFVKPGGGWADMTQTVKLTASDGAANDGLGISVAVSGDTIVVGAYNDDIGPNSGQGSAYVFVKPGGGWTDMTQTAKLTASDGAASDWFGYSVGVSGDTVVVGAVYDDIGPSDSQGSAYAYGIGPSACTLIVSSEPADCALDARQPHPIGSIIPAQGFTMVDVRLNPQCIAATLTPTDFMLSLTPGPIGSMVIDSVTGADNVATVMFNQPVPPQNWACVRLAVGLGKACLGLLPGDVNDSLASNAQDITALINHLNRVPGQVRPLYKVDMNRSNAADAQDITQLINLLKGAGEFDPWLNETIPACPP